MSGTRTSTSSKKTTKINAYAGATVISIDSKKVVAPEPPARVERFLDYISPKELELLTHIRGRNKDGALASLGVMMPDTIDVNVRMLIKAYQASDETTKAFLLRCANKSAEESPKHKAPVLTLMGEVVKPAKKVKGRQ